MNVKKTKKFKENRPENYHVHDRFLPCILKELNEDVVDHIVITLLDNF